jgi:hypothetical protein
MLASLMLGISEFSHYIMIYSKQFELFGTTEYVSPLSANGLKGVF